MQPFFIDEERCFDDNNDGIDEKFCLYLFNTLLTYKLTCMSHWFIFHEQVLEEFLAYRKCPYKFKFLILNY